jgi:uncharacterized protein involved in type VI secretion and phage assembly
MSDQTPADIFADMSVSKVLISVLETVGEVQVPTSVFVKSSGEDKELQVDYNEDDKSFVFKLKDREVPNDN